MGVSPAALAPPAPGCCSARGPGSEGPLGGAAARRGGGVWAQPPRGLHATAGALLQRAGRGREEPIRNKKPNYVKIADSEWRDHRGGGGAGLRKASQEPILPAGAGRPQPSLAPPGLYADWRRGLARGQSEVGVRGLWLPGAAAGSRAAGEPCRLGITGRCG